MEKYIVIAGLMIGTAIAFPTLIEQRLGGAANDGEQVESESLNANDNQTASKTSYNPLDGRKARIRMDSRGHFIADARMNGRKGKVLVDTGATYVAINESTARKLGIRLKDADFKYKVRTANGIKLAAAAMIDEIEIGRVRVKNVRASVSRDSSLSQTLLGMSFLKKLKKFEISGNMLVLTQ